MRYVVTIQIVENGYVVSYRDYIKKEAPQNQYIPAMEHGTTIMVDRNIIMQSEEEIATLLKELRAKVGEVL